MSGFVLPGQAHVPGRNARHREDYFDGVKTSAQPGMTADALSQSDAFRAGFVCYDEGYFWEAHEVWEAVWMATAPNSHARHFVQALIQLANGQLKRVMDRPKAAARLCDMALAHLAEAGDGGGLARVERDMDWVSGEIHTLRNAL